MKYITFTVPCYNSQDYMERCIDSLLPGGEDVEIIIVNDGSTDATAQIADDYAGAVSGVSSGRSTRRTAAMVPVSTRGWSWRQGPILRWWIRMTGWMRRHMPDCLRGSGDFV